MKILLFPNPNCGLSDLIGTTTKEDKSAVTETKEETTAPPAEIESKYLPVTAVVLGPMTIHMMPTGVQVAIIFSEQIANEILADYQSTPDFATEFANLVEIVGREVRIPVAVYNDFKGYFVAKGWLNEETEHTPLNYPLLERTIVDSKQKEIEDELEEEERAENTDEEEINVNL